MNGKRAERSWRTHQLEQGARLRTYRDQWQNLPQVIVAPARSARELIDNILEATPNENLRYPGAL
jgi:hypothetical protein